MNDCASLREHQQHVPVRDHAARLLSRMLQLLRSRHNRSSIPAIIFAIMSSAASSIVTTLPPPARRRCRCRVGGGDHRFEQVDQPLHAARIGLVRLLRRSGRQRPFTAGALRSTSRTWRLRHQRQVGGCEDAVREHRDIAVRMLLDHVVVRFGRVVAHNAEAGGGPRYGASVGLRIVRAGLRRLPASSWQSRCTTCCSRTGGSASPCTRSTRPSPCARAQDVAVRRRCRWQASWSRPDSRRGVRWTRRRFRGHARDHLMFGHHRRQTTTRACNRTDVAAPSLKLQVQPDGSGLTFRSQPRHGPGGRAVAQEFAGLRGTSTASSRSSSATWQFTPFPPAQPHRLRRRCQAGCVGAAGHRQVGLATPFPPTWLSDEGLTRSPA